MAVRRDQVVSFALLLGVAGTLAVAGWALRRTLGAPAGGGPEPADLAYHLDPGDPRLGERSYAFCQGCHQGDGAGIPGTYPPLAGHPRALGPPEALIRVTLHGYDARSGLWNGAMPAFAGRLADHEVAAALSHVRGSWGNRAGAVAPATVAAVRRADAGRTRAWTADELPQAAPP